MNAHPDAVPVTPEPRDRAEWLDARREGVGGSDASTIAGVNPYSSLYELWLDKTGRAIGEKEPTPEMRFGNLIEPVARRVFAEDTGIDVTEHGLLRSVERPWQMVTPDGITSDGGLLECKSVGWRAAYQWVDGQTADHAEVQVQWGMDVTGLRHAWVVAVIEREFVIRRVEYDPQLAETVREMGRDFWERNVLGDVEPPLVASDLAVVSKQYPTVDEGKVVTCEDGWLAGKLMEYRAAQVKAKAAAEHKDQVQAEIVAFIGDAEAASVRTEDGAELVVAMRKEYTTRRVDTKALGEQRPDVYAEYVRRTPYRQLNILKKPRKVD